MVREICLSRSLHSLVALFFIMQIYFLITSPASREDPTPASFGFFLNLPIQARLGVVMTTPCKLWVRDQYGKSMQGVCIKASVDSFTSVNGQDYCSTQTRKALPNSIEMYRTETVCKSRLAGAEVQTDDAGLAVFSTLMIQDGQVGQ